MKDKVIGWMTLSQRQKCDKEDELLQLQPGPFMLSLRTRMFAVLCLLNLGIAVVASYFLQASAGHSTWLFPFISDGGGFAPESCFFGFFLSFSGFFWWFNSMSITAHLICHIKRVRNGKVPMVYIIGLTILTVLGTIIGIGLVMVGSYQETTENKLHTTGALLAFFQGQVYMVFFTAFNFFPRPAYSRTTVAVARVIMTVLAIISFWIPWIGNNGGIPVVNSNGTEIHWPEEWPEYEMLRVPADSPYYSKYLWTTINEWILASIFAIFVLSTVIEQSKLCVTSHRAQKHYDRIQSETEKKEARRMILYRHNTLREDLSSNLSQQSHQKSDTDKKISKSPEKSINS